MVTAPTGLIESYPATPDSVGLIRTRVAGYAGALGLSDEKLEAVRLAVSEAVTNVVVHAYRERPGHIQVMAIAAEDELCVLIADEGCGLQTPPVKPGLGWGLALITDACDRFTLVERSNGGTEARLGFRISEPGQVRGSVASDTSPAKPRFSTTT